MIDQIRGLPNVYTVVSPAAYRAQTEKGAESASPHLHHSRDESAGVTVSLSPEALALIRGDTSGGNGSQQGSTESRMDADTKDGSPAAESAMTGKPAVKAEGASQSVKAEGPSGEEELSEEEQHQVKELQSRDREVRAHERAHLAAAGGLATGGASYTYQTGPDGRRYAIGGEVSITIEEGDDPEETIRNAQQAQRAALAPADPSAQDRQVAAAAAGMAAEARREMAGMSAEESGMTGGKDETAAPAVQAQTQVQEKPAAAAQTTQKPAGETEREDPFRSADAAAAVVRGRQAFSRQAQTERGYGFGYAFSSMSLAA